MKDHQSRRRCPHPAASGRTAASSRPVGLFDLTALAEHETAEPGRRRLERHLAEARRPPGKTLDAFDFEAVSVVRLRSWRSPPATPG
jgi:hypothetical protein